MLLSWCSVGYLCYFLFVFCCFFFFKQKTAYEMRISDWSSDVCSSDLAGLWRVRNISDRGMMLAADVPIAVGEKLEIALSDTVALRSEERRVGKEGVSKVRYRWLRYHLKKKKQKERDKKPRKKRK